jgi:hypothetical protein
MEILPMGNSQGANNKVAQALEDDWQIIDQKGQPEIPLAPPPGFVAELPPPQEAMIVAPIDAPPGRASSYGQFSKAFSFLFGSRL